MGAPASQNERVGSWWQTMEKNRRMPKLTSGEVASSGATTASAASVNGAIAMALLFTSIGDRQLRKDSHALPDPAQHFERPIELGAGVRRGHDGADARLAFG